MKMKVKHGLYFTYVEFETCHLRDFFVFFLYLSGVVNEESIVSCERVMDDVSVSSCSNAGAEPVGRKETMNEATEKGEPEKNFSRQNSATDEISSPEEEEEKQGGQDSKEQYLVYFYDAKEVRKY